MINLLRPIEVVPNIYQLRAVGARVTLLFGERGVALVDAGGRGSLGLITSGLKALGSSQEQVRLIVLTHCHPDHCGGLGSLVEATGAKVAVHRREVGIISGAEPSPNPFHNRLLAGLTHPFVHRLYGPPAKVDFFLNDGDPLPFFQGVQVVHTPGHTPGSICLYVVSEKVLIVGDALQHRFHRLSPPASVVTQDPKQARESLEKLLTMDFDTICFSHFPPLRQMARCALQRLVQKTGS